MRTCSADARIMSAVRGSRLFLLAMSQEQQEMGVRVSDAHSPTYPPSRGERNMCQHSDQLYLSYQFLPGINMLISRGWRHGNVECRRENMRSHNSVSCDNKRQSRKVQTSVSRNKCVFKSGQMGVQNPPRRL